MAGALDGLRVVDLTRVLAGPLCTMWLGDMGADVIKVEVPRGGDDTRAWGPPYAGTESAYFVGVNRNKRSVGLDLGTDDGRDLLKRLVREADVVVENFKIGTLARWGLTDGWFEEQAPRVVRCSISGYGSTGPQGGKPGYDFIAQAETGLMAITGEQDGQAMKTGVAIVDICTGMLAMITILGALEARHATGKGQQTEVNLHDTGIQLLANVAANHLVSGSEAARYGNGHPNIVPYRTYRTADGDLAVSVGNDVQFARFATALGHPEWADDERFRRNQDRIGNRALVDGLIEEVMLTGTRAQWLEVLESSSIPVGPINSVAEALSSQQTRARDMVMKVDLPDSGVVSLLGIPFRMSGTPPSVRHPPPTLGEHTRQVLSEQLGLDEAELTRLERSGVTTMEEA